MTMQTATTTAAGSPPIPLPGRERAPAATALCLIVHDEMELRLRLAGLVRRAMPSLGADTVTRAGFDAISMDRMRAYAAVMFIIEFSPPEAAAGPLANLARLHEQLPGLPVFVFARGGNERTAARAMKLGACDYWPIHAVVVGELCSSLQTLLQPAANREVARAAAADRWQQPEIAGYTVLKKIAQSSSAGVFLARSAEFEHPVALKLQAIKGSRTVSDADRARFVRECEILSKLNHRSIANVLDYGITDEHSYLALEYFPCGSLRDRLRNPVSETEALNYAHQIGEALQIVHAAQITHRDLKPSNLMLTNDNRLVLIDFGSARTRFARDDLSQLDDCTGTPYYVAPEQAEDREPDARADLYSVGVVLFEMLAGHVPFEGRNLAAILGAHRASPVPRLPAALQSYQAIVERLLAKDPLQRFLNAAEFLDALDALRADSPARKPSKTTRST